MFNCPGCWDNPCTCGKDFQHFTNDKIREQIKMLQGILLKRAHAAGTLRLDGILKFDDGLNIAELKDILMGMPEVDAEGKPFKVLIAEPNQGGCTVPAEVVEIEETKRRLVDGSFGKQITLYG